MCSELCNDFYVVYQLEMVAGEVGSSCQLVVTFFFFFLVSPYQTTEISLGQLSGAPPHIDYFLRRCLKVVVYACSNRQDTYEAILLAYTMMAN